MRFLIDNGVSPLVAAALVSDGHDAVHVRAIGLHQAADSDLFNLAASEDRVLVSVDTDFGALLAGRKSAKPSVVLFRSPTDRRPGQQVELLRQNLPQLEDALRDGAMVVFEHARIRVRRLPIL